MKKDLLNGRLIRSDLASTHCGFTIHITLRQDKRRNSLIKRC